MSIMICANENVSQFVFPMYSFKNSIMTFDLSKIFFQELNFGPDIPCKCCGLKKYKCGFTD